MEIKLLRTGQRGEWGEGGNHEMVCADLGYRRRRGGGTVEASQPDKRPHVWYIEEFSKQENIFLTDFSSAVAATHIKSNRNSIQDHFCVTQSDNSN